MAIVILEVILKLCVATIVVLSVSSIYSNVATQGMGIKSIIKTYRSLSNMDQRFVKVMAFTGITVPALLIPMMTLMF